MTSSSPTIFGQSGHRPASTLVVMTALLALLVCAALQIWRPCFFLTDDNVVQWLPPTVEMSRHLHEDKPVFVSASLFGGNYDWSSDVTIFPFLSPLLPLLSPLARSSAYFVLIDVITTFNFMVIAAAFAAAAVWLRKRHEIAMGDWAVVAVSLSYAFAPLHLLYGASWLGFVNAQAAWPLAFVALQFSAPARSVATLFLAFGFALFGGNLHPFGFLLIGCGCLAIYFACEQRSIRPMLCLGGALGLVALLAFLIVGSGLSEVAVTARVRSFDAATSSALNVPPLALAASFFAGPLAGSAGGPAFLFRAEPMWKSAIAYSALNWSVFVMLILGAWKNRSSRPVLVGLALAILFICRPGWLADVVAMTPILRSTRWPFREVTVLIFLVHLIFLLNYPLLSANVRRIACLAALVPLLFLLAAGPPTFNPMGLSRRLIMTGVADDYWRTLRPMLTDHRNVVSIDPRLVREGKDEVPFPLLPSQNLAALFGIVSASGYSTSSAFLLDRSKPTPFSLSGMYTPENGRQYLARFPEVRLTTVEQLNPPIWSIVEAGRERRFQLDPENLQIRELPVPSSSQ